MLVPFFSSGFDPQLVYQKSDDLLRWLPTPSEYAACGAEDVGRSRAEFFYYRLAESDYLFPSQWNTEKPLSRGFFHKWFSETAQAAGLDVAKQHPHAMRHGFDFTMSAAGHNPQTIAQALGHQTARMALQFYGSVTDEVADQARKQAFSKYSWL